MPRRVVSVEEPHVKIEFEASNFFLEPGDVFTVNLPSYSSSGPVNITNQFRVTEISYNSDLESHVKAESLHLPEPDFRERVRSTRERVRARRGEKALPVFELGRLDIQVTYEGQQFFGP